MRSGRDACTADMIGSAIVADSKPCAAPDSTLAIATSLDLDTALAASFQSR